MERKTGSEKERRKPEAEAVAEEPERCLCYGVYVCHACESFGITDGAQEEEDATTCVCGHCLNDADWVGFRIPSAGEIFPLNEVEVMALQIIDMARGLAAIHGELHPQFYELKCMLRSLHSDFRHCLFMSGETHKNDDGLVQCEEE